MTSLRTAAAAVLSTLSAFLVASGCGSDAVGVDACRDIEAARCEAAQHCGFLDESVEQCQRFYRDHCLHGIKSGKEPGDIALDRCIGAIQKAGQCAKDGKATLVDCQWGGETPLTTPCEVVQFPQDIEECGFLREEELDASVPGADTGSDSSPDAPADAATDATDGG